MLAVLWPVLLVAKAVALIPVTIVWYIVYIPWKTIENLVVIPLLLIARIMLFGFIYMPLTPVLQVLDVEYNNDVPVEVSLYRLLVDLQPHFFFFIKHLTHYVMVSVFVGSFVGMIAGLNISIVNRVLSFQEPKKAKGPRLATKSRATPNIAKLQQRMEERIKKEMKEPAVTVEAVAVKKEPLALLSNIPVVKQEPQVRVLSFKPKPTAPGEEVYEDDDGYSYMAYEDAQTDISEPNSGSGETESSSGVVPTILEESDSELSPEAPNSDDSLADTPRRLDPIASELLRHYTVRSAGTLDTTFSRESEQATLVTSVTDDVKT